MVPDCASFGAVSLAFIGLDHTADSHLASNKFYTIAVVLAIYWLATLISMKGLGWVGKVSKIGGILGTIIPAGLLVVCGVIYLATGGQSQMSFQGSFWPDFSNFDNVVLAASIFLFDAEWRCRAYTCATSGTRQSTIPKPSLAEHWSRC